MARIVLVLEVVNAYADGCTDRATETLRAPAPADGYADTLEDWANVHAFPLTGGGHPGRATYTVTVRWSDHPALVPEGTSWEWSG